MKMAIALSGIAICGVPVLVFALAFMRRGRRSTSPFTSKTASKGKCTVLLTGATSPKGTGSKLAMIFRKQGSRLVLVGQQNLTQLLQECSGDAWMVSMLRDPTTVYVQADLEQLSCGQTIAKELRLRGVDRLDILVQLASAEVVSNSLSAQSESSVRRCVSINLRAAALVAKHCLPFMHVHRSTTDCVTKTAKLCFVSSVVSQCPAPYFASYTASQCALDHLAWSLETEFADANIAVQLLHEGMTQNPFYANNRVPDGELDRLAQQLHDAIEFSEEFRTILGSFRERARFYAGWMLPVSLWQAWRARDVGRLLPPMLRCSRRGAGSTGIAVVTGGSRGIGRALIEGRPSSKYPRVLSLSRTCSGQCIGSGVQHVQVDLASLELTAKLQKALPSERVGLVVHNAALNVSGRFSFISDQDIDRMCATNIIAPILLSAICLKHNQKLGNAPPDFVFVSSASHFFSYPGAAIYGATKDGLGSFAKTLGFALSGSSPASRVLTVFPGPVRTEMARNSSPAVAGSEDEKRREANRMLPEALSTEIWDAVERHDTTLIPLPIRSYARRAGRDPVWAASMMKATQLDPLVARHTTEHGHAGL